MGMRPDRFPQTGDGRDPRSLAARRDRSFYEALAAAEPKIGEKLRDYPLAEAQLRALLGDLYASRSDERAIPQYKRALELRRRELGPDHEQTFNVMESVSPCWPRDA